MTMRIIVIALILAATSAHAGFKMFVPGQKEPVMYGNETAEEKASSEANDAEYLKIRDELREQTAKKATPARKTGKNPLSVEDIERGKPPIIDDGPRPGGHRRHEWREKTGFNTPAERTRYRMEIYRLKQELKKERARPNPGGAHPTEIRKQHKTSF
jgi:hypothetical protein